jgi:urea carboxylase
VSDTASTAGARDHARSQDGTRVVTMPTVPATAAVDLPPGVEAADVVWDEVVAPGGYASKVVDRGVRHVLDADEAVLLGPPPAAESYLRADLVVAAALRTGAEAVHPGYGLLSEDASFAEACAQAGLVFIGPTPEQLRVFGRKHTARALAREAGVPLLAGSELVADRDEALATAETIGYPVMLKASAGGGGIGMRRCHDPGELAAAFDAVVRQAEASFGGGGVFLERYVARARHVEVQAFGDGEGGIVLLGERDCSVQRRNQKVLEESPAPLLADATRAGLLDSARRLLASVAYRSAGTVEFVVDVATGEAAFLEVNTRLQVEHGVTELRYGVDLVEWMVRLAAGEQLDAFAVVGEPRGHAIEARLYAEDPLDGFRPCAGLVTAAEFPDGVRVDTWVEPGTEVSPWYVPLLAKVVVWDDDRPVALAALDDALSRVRIGGVQTNRDLLLDLVRHADVVAGQVSTSLVDGVSHQPASVSVLDGGLFTTVQDLPGRLGFWDVGVPPSGPMDDRSFALVNRLVGNPESAAALECTVLGPTLRFEADGVVALGVRSWTPTSTVGRCRGGPPSPWWRDSSCAWARSWDRGRGPTWPWPAASTCPTTSGAGPRSCSEASVATPGAACAPVTCWHSDPPGPWRSVPPFPWPCGRS